MNKYLVDIIFYSYYNQEYIDLCLTKHNPGDNIVDLHNLRAGLYGDIPRLCILFTGILYSEETIRDIFTRIVALEEEVLRMKEEMYIEYMIHDKVTLNKIIMKVIDYMRNKPNIPQI